MPVTELGIKAEKDLGMKAEDDSLSVARDNVAILAEALEAFKTSKSFLFTDRANKPILAPIYFPAKEFFFSGIVESPITVGCGALIGGGMTKVYPLPSITYNSIATQGGASTRFTQINGDDYSCILRLRGNGAYIQGINFLARPYPPDGTGGGPLTGWRTPTGIEIEGRGTSVATGNHEIVGCGFQEFTHGVKSLAGYYDGDTFVEDESHADNINITNSIFWGNDNCITLQNQQSVIWNINNTQIGGFGGANERATTLINAERGGCVFIRGVNAGNRQITIFKVRDWSPFQSYFTCENFAWDRFVDGNPYLTIFKYDGTGFADSSWLKWKIRAEGNIPNDNSGYFDPDLFFQFPSNAINFPTNDILVDFKGMQTDNLTRLGHMYYPTIWSDWSY